MNGTQASVAALAYACERASALLAEGKIDEAVRLAHRVLEAGGDSICTTDRDALMMIRALKG